ncbi:MAG: thymidine phosphorylase [Deltaproteobacteria bacterium]|nr:thymidine phosphorylase [Deltaproteobacteria bacterium]
MIIPYALIQKKKRGEALASEEMRQFFKGYLDGTVADYQMSAFLMAVCFQGLNSEEVDQLTQIMMESGKRFDFSGAPKTPRVDKHSTGGVGDKLTLIIVPMVMAGGIQVPMICGRGLGHTGGTIDKLESIPGFRTDKSLREATEQVKRLGAVILGQTPELDPLDSRLYHLRDVTATVDCLPLIASSIMSKKIAEGIQGLVLDVKVGTGAFQKTLGEAQDLARELIRIGERFGVHTVALLTRMDEPLGESVGNRLEVLEAMEVLKGKSGVVRDLSLTLAGWMFYLGKKASSAEEGFQRAQKILDSGQAYSQWERLVSAQGGDLSQLLLAQFPSAQLSSEKRPVEVWRSPTDGFVESMNGEEIGIASIELGAGRRSLEDSIDPDAGLRILRHTGDKVSKGEPLVELYACDEKSVPKALARLTSAYRFSNVPPQTQPLILGVMDKDGIHPISGR